MSDYRGFIALIPRENAAQWISGHTPRAFVPVLQAFASDEAWDDNHTRLPSLGGSVRVNFGAISYFGWQFTGYNDVLALACFYVNAAVSK